MNHDPPVDEAWWKDWEDRQACNLRWILYTLANAIIWGAVAGAFVVLILAAFAA